MIPEKQSTYVKAYMNPDTGKMEYKSIGDAIKAADANRVSGYLVRFTDASDPDLHGEYFTKDTNFWLKEHSPIGKPIMLDHAFDAKFKSVPVGIIDFAKEDEIGIWIEGKLKERAEYEDMLRGWKERKWIDLDDSVIAQAALGIEKAVKTFFSTGKAQWSSGALPQSVEVADDGHIQSWAFIEGTGVMTPAEPDGTEIKIKRAFQELDKILTSVSTATATKEANQESKESDADNANPINDDKTSEKDTKMDEEMVRQIIRMVLEESKQMTDGEQVVEEEDLVDAVAMDGVPDEEKAKMDDEELAKAVAEKAWAVITDKIAKRQKALDAVNKVNKQHLRNAPVTDDAHLPNASLRNNPRISVSENLKFAHLSAEDMALGYMLIESDHPKSQRGRIPANMLVSDDYLRHMVNKSLIDLKDRSNFKTVQDWSAVKSALPYKTDDFDATNISGQGQDWVGTLYGTRLWEKARDEAKVFNELSSRGMFMQEIPQGHKSVVIPTEGADPIAYSTPEANDLDAAGRPEVTANIGFIGTGSKTLTAAQIKIAGAATDELIEDSIIPFLPQMNQQIQIKGIETLDQALINGDTETAGSTNINLIDATPGTGTSRPYYLAVDGLRKFPLVTSTGYSDTAGGAAPTLDLYRQLLKEFSSAVRERLPNLFYLIDSDTHNVSLAIPEIATEDVRRTNATVQSGRLLNIYGVDVITSGFLPLTNTAGKVSNTGSNNVLGQVMLVYAPFWAFGWKRNVRVDTEYSAISGTTVSVASMRFGFTNRGSDASAIRYNVGVAG